VEQHTRDVQPVIIATLRGMDISAVIETIDAANAQDPNEHNGKPLALHQGQRATVWVDALTPGAVDADRAALLIAARAHHLRRWEVPRSTYPEGRPGYLKWRRDAKARHASLVDEILVAHGWDEEARDRVATLVLRRNLGSDAATQVVEDAACLVFLETQYDEMIERLDREHMVSVVAKTIRKMSARALELAATVELSETGTSVLGEALDQAQSA